MVPRDDEYTKRLQLVGWNSAAAEREAGVRAAETWDTNAITPGTEFMEKLGFALKGLCEARSADGRGSWEVSGADEAGEGNVGV
jgi:5'-3' exonuclease